MAASHRVALFSRRAPVVWLDGQCDRGEISVLDLTATLTATRDG